MSLHQRFVTTSQDGVAALRRREPGTRMRNFLHLLMVLSIWLSTVSPLLAPAQPVLAAETADRVTRVVTPPAAAAARAPYRAGMEPAFPSALTPAVKAEANAPVQAIASRTAASAVADSAANGFASELFTAADAQLAPAWLAAATATDTQLAPEWLASAAAASTAPAANSTAGGSRTPAWPAAAPATGALTLGSPFGTLQQSGPMSEGPLWAAGQCRLEGLALASAVPLSVVQGDTVTPYTFTLVISNTGYVTPTGALSLTLQVPDNFYFVGNSAAARSQLGGALTVVQPPLNLAAGTPAQVTVRAQPAAQTLLLSDVITVTYRLAATTGGAPNPSLTTTLSFAGEPAACSTAATANTSFCPLSIRLPMQLQIPPYIVGFGNTTGDLYTVTLRNTGVATATDISLEIDPSAGFFFKGASASGQHSSYGSLTLAQPSSDTLAGAPFVLRPTAAFPANSLAPNAVITTVFRLGTDAAAKSGQPLSVTLRSGAAVPQVCSSTRENIPTGRGNLVISKQPDVQPARLGEVVTWTVQLRNTGLGSVYDAVLNEAPGNGIRVLSITPPLTVTPEIRADQSVFFTVTAEVSSCTDLRNEARAWWPIGNPNATALITNPVSDDAFLSYVFDNPVINLAVEPPADLEFCGRPQRTVVVTVTNTGGPASDLSLQTSKNGPFLLTTTTPNWVQAGNVLRYTDDGGLLRKNETITLSLTVSSTTKICDQNSGSFSLQPSYRYACPANDPPVSGATTNVSLQSPLAPSLTLQKRASTNVIAPGDTVFYTVTVFGRNPISSAIGPIHITDTLPPIFQPGSVVRSDSMNPLPVADDNNIDLIITPTVTPTYSIELYITATLPTSSVCGSGVPQINRAWASAETCPECLSSSDSHTLYVEDPDPIDSGGYFRLDSERVMVCDAVATQQTAVLSITNGITWTESSYRDNFNRNGGAGPLNLVAGSVTVNIDGIDRTSDVTVTAAPELDIQFDNVGGYSQTAQITISYQVTAGDAAATGSAAYFAYFTQSGFDNPNACGVSRYTPVFIDVFRGALDKLDVGPASLASCGESNVVLGVDGKYLDVSIADQVVLTFTTDASDILTLTAPYLQLGGGFAGQPVTVTTATVGASQVVSFTFEPTLDLTRSATITFPLYRNCGVATPLNTQVSYADQCRVTKTLQSTGGQHTRQSNLLLRAPEITYTLDARDLTWEFGVRNAGDMDAADVLITNTLPYGIHYRSDTRSGLAQPLLDAIVVTTGTINPGTPDEREVISFTVPSMPANSSLQISGNAAVATCNPSDSIWIRLTDQGCGGVGEACGGSQMARLGVQEGQGLLLTSNTQQATIPLCAAGDVRLIVKNASLKTDLYDLQVQQLLTDVTYVPNSAKVQLVHADGTSTAFLPFTPTLINPTNPAAPYQQTLEWDGAQMDGYDPEVRALLATQLPGDKLVIEFGVRTYCTSPLPSVQAFVNASNSCSTVYRNSEDSRAVAVTRPTLALQKQVRNVTEDGAFAPNVLAGQGDTLVWQVRIDNSSDADVAALFVTDTLPAWFSVTEVYTAPTVFIPPVLHWEIISDTTFSPPVPAQDTTSFWITGTVGMAACADSKQNVVEAAYGCSELDVCPSSTYTAAAQVDTAPIFAINTANATFDQCDSGPLAVTFANTGARTGAIAVTYTLPAGYQYAGLAPGTLPAPDSQPLVGEKGKLVFGYDAIAQQQITNTLMISIARDLSAPGACINSAAVTATLGFADTCGIWNGDAAQDSGQLTILRPDLSTFSQTPISQTVVAGQPYTWTITAPNTGSAPAHNFVVTQTLPVGLEFITATLGTGASDNATPSVSTVGGRTVITWSAASLAAGSTWTARVSARPVTAAVAYSITAQVHAACDDSGCEQSAAAVSYDAPLQSFDKQVSQAKVSIGEPFFYTITTDFYGSIPYTSAQLVDTLPKLGGRLVFSYTDIAINNIGADSWLADTSMSGIITFTPSGGVVNGPSNLTVRISGIISNEVNAQQGSTFVNALALSNYVDGQLYRYNDSVSTQVKEPLLAINKAATPTANVRADSTITYTLVVAHAAASDATAYNVVITDAVPAALTYNPGSLLVSAPAPGTVVSSTVGNSLAITVSEYSTPSAPIYITFTASANQQLQPSSRYTNTAYVRYTSQPGDNPNDRDGSGSGPNDYWSSSSSTITSTAAELSKRLLNNLDFTIGDFITYTVVVTLPAGTTRNLIVTDSVPAGLLYLPATSTLSVAATAPMTLSYVVTPSSGTGAGPSTAILRMLDPVYNNTGATAAVTWTMRLLVVDDPARTVNYNGAVKGNAVTATYVNAADQLQTLVSNAGPARLFEPLLQIGKEYVTAQACPARLLADNFNSGSIAGWTIANGAWSAGGGWLVAPSSAKALLIHGPDAWSDVSYSAIFSSTDTAGDVGLIFRAQNTANYYRFVWTRTAGGTGFYQIIKVVSGVDQNELTSDLGPSGGYTINRWYHLEMRSIGRQHKFYIDGRQVLTYTDNSVAPFLTGSIGFYANNESGLVFDDALVTKLGAAGCLVDVNDLITYTLTISNQERLVGHNLIITDVLPQPSLQYVAFGMTSSDPAAVVLSAPAPGSMGELVWTVNQLAPVLPFNPLNHGSLVLTVTARVMGDVSAGLRLSNQALLAYDSQFESGPAGVERSYSGGSHSTGVRTSDATVLKTGAPLTVTIGERLHYTLTLPALGGIPATLYTATVTDTLPSGFRMLGEPAVAWSPDTISPANVDVSRSTTKTAYIDFTRIPSGTQVTVVITGVVENIAANQEGVQYTNTATLGWRDLADTAVPPVTSDPVTTTLVEPKLIIEKLVTPKSVRPGDTVFYRVRVYHAPGSTVPAYNVVISDIVPANLSYISGSWPRNNTPLGLAATGVYTEFNSRLEAYFPVISTTFDANNALDITFQAVVNLETGLGTQITNVVTTTWQSLAADPDGERRDGSGGINDYRTQGPASISLDLFNLVKTGPLTTTAGSVITYAITLRNNSSITGSNVIVHDVMPFQLTPITATFVAPLGSGACAAPYWLDNRAIFDCSLLDLPPYSSATVTVTGKVDPATPDGASINNEATATYVDANGNLQTLVDNATTTVDTNADLSIKKQGPATAMAGETITYTLVVTNSGPSYAHGVDIKDALPPGISFVGGSTSQGACVSSICQLGTLAPNVPVTMVITGTVGPGVAGVVTNTGYIFAATTDSNPSNNSSALTTTIGAKTALHVSKVDFTDPAYAGSTYFYQILVTNTGPATAFNVVVTDTLPAAAEFEGASPGCAYAAGKVSCVAGDMLPGSWFGFLINVRVPDTIVSGTVVTNVVAVGTTTAIITASSVLSASAATTWLQTVGSPTDLAIGKRVAPAQVIAGSGAPITYTLVITNQGPAPATAVQVSDLYPRAFSLVSIQSSRGVTESQCSNGGVCDLGALAVGEVATVTLVMLAPANVAAGFYTNTAYVGSPAPDSNPNNNTANAAVQVTAQVSLQAHKAALPNPAFAGEALAYTIFITNSGPSNANNVTLSDTLPAGFTPELIVSSQGGCAALPCNLGVLASGANAWVTIHGSVAAAVTQPLQLANSALITASEYLTGVVASVTPGLSNHANFVLDKRQIDPLGTVNAGALVTYTLRLTNTGPGLARSVDIKDQLPPGMSVERIAAEGGVCVGALCQFGSVAANSTRAVTVVVKLDPALRAGVYTNTGAAFSPDAPTITSTVATTVITLATLRVSKVALNNPVTAGGQQLYQVVVYNEGPSAAQAVLVTDTLPAGTSYAGGDSACTATGATVVCNIGVLAANASRSLLLQVNVDSGVSDGATLTNEVAAGSPTAVQDATASVTSTVRQPVDGVVDLAVTKVGPARAVAGERIVYTLTITNSGPATAQEVQVVDALPLGVTYVGAQASQGLCESGVSCRLGEMAGGASASIVVTGLVNASLISGTLLINRAQVGSGNVDSNPLNNSDSYTTTAEALALLTLEKEAQSASVAPNGAVTYRITVRNSGPSTARAVVVADALPVALVNVLVSSSRGGCSGFPCSLGDLEPGGVATIVVVGTVASSASGDLVNSASVTSATALDPASVVTAGATVTVVPSADLALRKDATPTAVAGGQVVYTLTVSNNGPSAAAYVTVTDALPAQVLFGSADTGCNEVGGVVICSIATLAAGASLTFHITGTVDATATPGSSIENRALVEAMTVDPLLSNNMANADSSIVGLAHLAIEKHDLADPVVAGELVTYTIVVTNAGPSRARAVVVQEQWPSGMTLESIVASDGGQCTGGLCQLGALETGMTRTLTVTLRVGSAVAAGVLVNVASVTSPDSDQAAPVVASEETTVTTVAALRVSKVALNNPVTAGGQQLYQVVVYNEGPSAAQAVLVTDTLPTGTSYAGGDAACTAAGNVVICDIGVLAANASRSLLLQVNVDAGVDDGATLTNEVAAGSPTAVQEATASVTSTVRQPVDGVVDLAVTKVGSPQATAGGVLTYTLIVTNNGPAAAQNVQLVDALPFPLTVIGGSISQGVCNPGLACQIGDLAAGMSVTLHITGLVNSGVLSGTLLVNSAQVGSSNVDSNLLNNRDSYTTSIDSRALLTLDKEAQSTSVAPGASLAYRITVYNAGPSLARNVVVTDALPGLLLNPLLSSSRGSCGAEACSLGDLEPGITATIMVMGVVSQLANGAIVNSAGLTTTTPLDEDSVLVDEVTTLVGDTADLVMAKSATPSVYAGQNITYVLSVYNTGPSLAAGVQILDLLPLSTTLMSVDAGCTVVDGQAQVRCPATPTTLANGAGISFTLVVATDASLATGTVLENRATATSLTHDPNPVNNTAVADTTIIGQADLRISKAADPQTVLAGELLTYTVVVTNTGPSNAGSVRLVDTLPNEVRQEGPVLTERTVSQFPIVCLNLVCELGAMPLGEVITLTLPVRVASAVAHNKIFTNTATVYSPSDVDPSNNEAKAQALAQRESTLVISKSAAPDPAVTGADLLYTIQVSNLGPSDADGVTVSDLLPAGFTPTGVTSSQGGCTSLPCMLGILKAGDSASILVRGKVSPIQGEALVNQTFVTATTPQTNTERSQTVITTAVTSSADLLLVLDSTPTAVAGLTATVYAGVVNHGPSSAVGALVTVTLPPGAHFNSAELPPGWTAIAQLDGTVVLATDQTLPPEVQTRLALVVDLDPNIAPGSSLAFGAVVASQTPDPTPDNNNATTDTSVVAQADFAIQKSGPDVLLAGTPVTYQITVQNNGPSAGSLRDIKDSLPPSLTLVAATLESAQGGATACVDAICQTARPVAVGEVLTMTVVAQVDPQLPAGTMLTNTATVFADGVTPDPVEANNQASHAAPSAVLAQITLDKYDLADPVYPDTLLVYALVVANHGPSSANNLVVIDMLPADVTYAGTTGSCDATPAGVVTCQVGSLAAGAEVTFQILVRVNPNVPNGALLRNMATLTSTTPLTNSILTADEETRVIVATGPLADIEVKKHADPPAVLTGDFVTFTMVVTNNGPAPANSVQLVDLMPDGLRLVSVRASQGHCNAGISCMLGALTYLADEQGLPVLRGTATVTIVAQAMADLKQGQILTNTAYVQSERQDPIPENNLSDVQIVVDALADLAIYKRATPLTLTAGQPVQYTLVVTNYGPAAALNTVVTDTLPPGFTVTRADGCAMAGQQLVCSLGNLAAGIVRVIDVLANSTADAAGVLTNSVEVLSLTPDPNLANNSSRAAVNVAPPAALADVQINKRDDKQFFNAGEPITYTLRVYNAGPSPAENVLVEDPLPPGVTYVGAEPAPTNGLPAAPRWAVGWMQPGAMITIALVVRTDADAFAGLLIRNTASVTTTTQDPVPANNSAWAQSQVFGSVDLAVRKTAQPTAVLAGGWVTYVVTVTNQGPSAARDVDIKELLPPSVTLTSLNPSRGTCVSQICQFGAMSAGEEIVVTATVLVDSSLPPGTIFTNTVAGFTDTPDTDPSNNQSSAPVIVGPLVNLAVTKLSQATTATVGTEITYTMIVTNHGPSAAPQVVLTDAMPAGFAYLRTTNPNGCVPLDRWYVVCELGAMETHQTKVIDLVFFIESVAPITVVNRVTVNDPNAINPDSGGQGEVVKPTDPKGPTAATITYFRVAVQEGALIVTWATETEYDTWSFRLWRSTVNDRSTAEMITADPILATGSGSQYSYLDTQVEPKIEYYYWLQEITPRGVQKELEVSHGGIDIDPPSGLFLPLIQSGSE